MRILLENYPGSDWLHEQIFEIEFKLLSKQRRYSEALGLLDQRLNLAREIGNEKQYKRLEKLQRGFITALNVSPGRIGVILPMSSSNVKIVRLVQETLNGLRLALYANKINALNDNPENSTSHEKTVTENSDNSSENELSGQFADSWELVIRDSHLDPQKTRKAILFSTHEIELAIQLCDKMLILDTQKSTFGEPCQLIERGSFQNLFPEDLISFDATTGSFKVKK
mgnify:CR=1 FL=1